MQQPEPYYDEGTPGWLVIISLVMMLFMASGKPIAPEPGPAPPQPTTQAARDYWRSYASLMADIWDEAANKAEAGDFKDAQSAHDWLAIQVSAARKAARDPIAQAEEATIPADNWDGKRAATLWRSFADQTRETVP